ncbi:MAG: DoxX family protein [Acidimicrobiia bacterium]|nr:DoxX family protein [Acidimicrobiia bacterium]
MTGTAWIVAFFLGMLFLATGAMKLIVPYEQGRARIGWIGDVPAGRYRLVGWLEIAGAIGLVFPTLVDAFDPVVPVAAGGLAAVMVGAMGLHARRHEWGSLLLTSVLLAGCVFVVVGNLG